MPGVIDPETVYVDNLPTIWSPVQWDLTEEERIKELEAQATASLLWAADVPETLLRLMLGETEIERAFEPPKGYDPQEQGDWDENMVTFQFKRSIEMRDVRREPGYVCVEYDFGDLGFWAVEIENETVTIEKI